MYVCSTRKQYAAIIPLVIVGSEIYMSARPSVSAVLSVVTGQKLLLMVEIERLNF
jgi:hypothetical protein